MMADTSNNLSLPACLDDVRIQTLPSRAYYIANFITEEEEAAILQKVARTRAAMTPCVSNRTDLDGAETEMEAADPSTFANVAV